MELTTYERDYLAWYARETDSTGDPFDPSTLVAAARAQWSDRPLLVLALARCTRSWQRNALYTFFLSRSAQRTRWHYAGHLFLQHPGWGTLCVDLLHDPAVPGGLSIGGIEYWDRVMGRPVDLGQLHQAFLRLAVQRMARTGAHDLRTSASAPLPHERSQHNEPRRVGRGSLSLLWRGSDPSKKRFTVLG